MQTDGFKKKFFWELGLGGGLSIFLIVVHVFVNSDIKGRVNSIVASRDQAAAQSRTIESLVRLKDSAERAVSYSSVLDRILPDQEQILNFRADVRLAAEQYGIEATLNFGQQTQAGSEAPGFTIFQIIARGAEERFIPFLRAIETRDHFIAVDSVDISETGDTFSATIGGRIFSI